MSVNVFINIYIYICTWSEREREYAYIERSSISCITIFYYDLVCNITFLRVQEHPNRMSFGPKDPLRSPPRPSEKEVPGRP